MKTQKLQFGLLLLCVCASQVLSAQSQKAITPTAEQLKAVQGYYRFANNSDAFIQVTSKGNRLVATQLWDKQQFDLEARSATEFYSTAQSYSIKFITDKSGAVKEALIRAKDRWIRDDSYTPPKFIKMSEEKLKNYEGRYTFQFQPGNDSFIVIRATKDGLTLTEEWSGDVIPFAPQSDVKFYSADRVFPLKFTLDKNGKAIEVLAFNRDLWKRVK